MAKTKASKATQKPPLRLEWRSPGDLAENPRNWRRHPQAQISALTDVLAEVGWAGACLYNERTGRLIDGHARRKVALDQGTKQVPVLVGNWTDEQEAKILATLDPLAAMAEADAEALDALLRDVSTESEPLREMLDGLAHDNSAELDRDRPKDDPGQISQLVNRAEELATKWKTADGQLWVAGPHRILCGDSTSAEDVERLMDGERALLMATDPPYMVDYHGGNHPRSLSNSLLLKDRHSADYQETDNPRFFADFLTQAFAHALSEKPALYVWHAHKRQAILEEALTEQNVLVHQQIIWVKARAVLTHSHYMQQHESCFYGWIKGKQPAKRPPSNSTTVWQIDQCGLEGIHPTEKPLEIFRRPIEYHTKSGDLVYEPFSGSGSQLVAAQELGRRCYAMEKSPAFVACALERLAAAGLKPKIAK